jgi:type III pantothenate kinase
MAGSPRASVLGGAGGAKPSGQAIRASPRRPRLTTDVLLTIDVGNTNIVLGVFEGAKLAESWRLSTLRERTADELGILIASLFQQKTIDRAKVDGIILSSVVPPLTRTIEEMTVRYFGRVPLTVDPSRNTGMPVLYVPPADVGADRVVNAVAAYELFGRPAANPVIVVDFGTATTFDAVSSRGEYLGGVICPGIGISADALFQRAARLPRVDVRKPASIIGQTTVSSMQAGLFFGYVAMVDGIVQRMRGELAGGERAACLATGGMADLFAGETATIQRVEPDLTLYGLRLIWERNR